MEKPHQNGLKTFEELNYAEQANSINAQMLSIEKSIRANIRRSISEGKENPLNIRIKNLEEIILRLKTK